ncbi:MAG TPA: DUF2207 domain-containing protein [Ardenticatenaceae bacterium]
MNYLFTHRGQLLALLLLLYMAVAQPSMATAQTDSDIPIRYLRYDTEIAIQEDGSFLVREVQEIEFNGSFSTAFAEIPAALTEDVEVLQLLEGDTPYERGDFVDGPGTYTVEEGENYFVEWEYEETEPGDVRTFTLEYRVEGGLWVYEDGDILEWRAVPADRSGFPVEASRVTVTLPAEVAPDDLQYTAYGPDYEVETNANSVTFEATEPIPDGTQFQVQVGFPHGLVEAVPALWQLEEDTANLRTRVESVEVELTVRPNGTIGVEERERVMVEAGALYEGYRTISYRYLDNVTNVAVFEGEVPFDNASAPCERCFQADERSTFDDWIRYDPTRREVVMDESQIGYTNLTWQVPPLVRGEATTFRLLYDVEGAIYGDDESQHLDWMVVHPEHDAAIEQAALFLHLPLGVAPNSVTVEGGAVDTVDGNTLAIGHRGTLEAGTEWIVRLDLPLDATSAPTPEWVTQLEEARAQVVAAEVSLNRQRLGSVVATLLIIVGGLLGTGLAWYRWGRDHPIELVADYLSEPPSDLPPGIVAYLLDEEPTAKGAMASLFHLATLGLLSIELGGGTITLHRNWNEKLTEGETITTAPGKEVTVPGHLVKLFNDLFPHLDHPSTLTSISEAFQHSLPMVYAEMGEEANQFFAALPGVARHRWLSFGQGLVLVGLLLTACMGIYFSSTLGWLAAAPALALLVPGVALIVVSRWMPQRTRPGAEEAGKWLAFKRYLLNLKEYGSQEEAQAILDEYFAYAVALDVEEVVLRQAEAAGGFMPVWTQPMTVRRSRPYQSNRTDSTLDQPAPGPLQVERQPVPQRDAVPSGPAQTPARPGLQGLSDSLSRSLQQSSDSLARILNSSAGQVVDTPFTMVSKATGQAMSFTWDATTTTAQVIGEIMEASASASGSGGGGGYRGSSSGSRSSSRSSWGSSSSRSSSSSSRSSSSRRSGGGGRRGFG